MAFPLTYHRITNSDFRLCSTRRSRSQAGLYVYTHCMVTEETIEAVANTSYELTFALFALGLFIFMKAKKVKFGSIFTKNENGKTCFAVGHRDKLLAAVFETAGQFTYVYALGGVDAVAAPILSSVCVVSLVLSRIFLKEKLPKKTYFFIAIVIIGILLLAVSEEL